MSGGQKQRIAIARAVIRAPRVLLLDEATSALDSESERIVQEALDKAAVGRTTIVVAHRLSTIHNADKIAVIQNGHVAESGSHEELSQDHNGIYTSLLRFAEITTSKEKASFPSIHTSNYTFSSLKSPTTSSSAEQIIETISQDDKEKAKQNAPIPSFSRLLLLNLPEWKQAILGCLSAALVGAVQPCFGHSMGSMISVYFLPNHNEIKTETKIYAFFFLGLAVFSLLINIIQHYNFAAMGEYLTKRIRESMLSKILTFEVEWFDQDDNSTGAICSRLAKDANSVRTLVGDRMALLVQTVSAVTISCTLGLVIALRLAVVMIAAQPIVIACIYGRRMLLKSMSKKSIKAQNESSKLAAEAVSNIRTVTAFSSQALILKMFGQAQEGPRRESNRQSWFAGIGLGTCRIILSTSWTLSFWYGGKLVCDGLISSKALFETFLVLITTGRVIADAGAMTTDLGKGADAVSSVFAVLDRSTRIEPEDPKGFKPDKLSGSVEFCDVHFVYPSRPDVTIFDGLTLSIDEGKSTALVGPSGSGKSTIIALIERFYDPLQGSVMIDGRDLKSYHLRCLRKHIALVSQEPTLFARTIKENIAYGGPENINESEILEAARAANAHDFITQLKDGYNTWCGDRGLQLSGGQKQRIAIARAILKNPSVLLLDEATSALDGQAERAVQEALEHLMVGRTMVVVAHRLSTIKNCDQIVVMDKGKVVEKGTHASLLDKGSLGAYYTFVTLQLRHNTVEDQRS
ncbi:hypothetical protein F0562_033400 [Nyssa sinensis]|uniref:Uncharacterized protein n=1 Tax=Nyssa sinensis TaxID=561372 RepID=A0A5J5AUG6_9ASTE|nr:hypothetical protein F0562_033400 [Nyssa sinensis]